MRLVLLGAPGSGKGTQASMLEAKYDCVHISTGDILRKNLSQKTELGFLAEGFMKKGELVPDDLVIKMMEERFSLPDVAKGFLIDGYPRTIPQAEALERILTDNKYPLDFVLLLNVAEEILIRRLANRKACRVCSKILNLLDVETGTKNCLACGGELYQRDDDSEQVIRNRLLIYRRQTEPLVAWYDKKGLLRTVQVQEHFMPEDTYKETEAALGL